jgi:hypothetical protein
MVMMKRLMLVGVLTAMLAPVAHADEKDKDKPAARMVWNVEVTLDGGKGDDGSVTLVMALADDHCSEADAWRGDTRYSVKVCDDSRPGEGAPVMVFDVRREKHSKSGATQQAFKVMARLASGKKAVLGKLSYADGAGLEVSAQITPQP